MPDPMLQKVEVERQEPFDRLASASSSSLPTGVNDNRVRLGRQQPEPILFQLPRTVWICMVTSYAVFLGALLIATGDGPATFAIAISAVYVSMFFGTAFVMMRQAPPQDASPLRRHDGELLTASGPLSANEAFAQVLIVPVCVALFAIAIALVSSL